MDYPINNENEAIDDSNESHQLILDGTVNLDYAEVDQVPRVRGLIEILEHFLGDRLDRTLLDRER
jgi:hypothetical protein